MATRRKMPRARGDGVASVGAAVVNLPERPARLAALLELGELLLPGNAALTREVVLAAEAPARFLARAGWHDGNPTDEALPWLALLAGLQKRRRVATIDWKCDPDEVMASVDAAARGLPAARERWAFTEGLDLESLDSTADFLELAGEQLFARGLRLISLDEESDSYLLLLVEKATAATVASLAKRAGHGDACTVVRAHTWPREPKKEKPKTPAKPRAKPRTRDELYPWTNLEYLGGTSRKFWAVQVFPRAYHLTWGRIGTQGQWKSKEFDRKGEAAVEAEKLLQRKLREGYLRASWRPPHFGG